MRPFYVFDRWGKQVDTVAWPLEATHKDALNGEDSLTLTIMGDTLTKGQRIVWRDKFLRYHEHTVADTTTSHVNGQLTETAYCENSISELLTDFLVEVEPRGATSQTALGRALEQSRWVTGTVQPTGTHDFSWYHQDAYSAVTDIVETFGAELETTIEVAEDVVVTRKVDILNHRGDDYGHLFTYGRNLAGIERVVATNSIYTALYGWGKGIERYDEETGEPTGGYSRKISFADVNSGQAWVGDEDARLRYGVPDGRGGVKHAFGQVEFSDCEDPAELLALTKEALKTASKPQVSYTGDVINLAAGGYTNGEDAQTGDTVYLRDKELDERLQGRVLEVERDLLDESNTTITLGNIRSTFTQKMAADLADLDWLKDQSTKWDTAVLLPDAYLDAVVNRLNILFNTTGGYVYYEKGEGLITYDKPRDQNPTMAIQITGAGFRIANSKNSDGSWNWRTFGTGDGFTADELITGVIKGGSNFWNLGTGDLLFEQGIIHDKVGNNSWNLSTGDLSITSGTQVGGLSLSDYITGIADDLSDEALKAANKAREEAIQKLEQERLTQQAIFNTLTNGGTVQGIYLQSGRVYINASYIGTGTLQAGKIQDKQGYNYWDLETGDFRIAATTRVGTSSSSQTLSSYIASNSKDSFSTATAQQVFNKLTNNGALQGLYMSSNQLYINATYIKSGAMDADLITTGRIQDKYNYNYWDLDSGELRMSATSTKVGTQTLQSYVDSRNTDSFSTATAQQVFNKLTNNGALQGLYMSSGNLYINATYLKTGTITDNYGYNYWNLGTGEFRLSANTKVGTSSSSQTLSNYISSNSKDSFASATALQVFNKLTNNGAVQGITMSGNNLYINATYINSGTLSGDRVRTGTISATSSNSSWNLNTGLFETYNTQVAGGQTHTMRSRVYNGELSLRMDNTDIGKMFVSTMSTDANVHSFVSAAFTYLVLAAPSNIGVSYNGSTSSSINWYKALYSASITYVESVTQSGTTVTYHRRSVTIQHGMATAQSALSSPGIEGPSMIAASVLPASEISSGNSLELTPVLDKSQLEEAADDGRMIWQVNDEMQPQEILYTGEGWTCDPDSLVKNEEEEEVVAAAPAYVDARAEVLQSEIEAIAEAVSGVVPEKSATKLTKRISAARASVMSKDELQMATVAQGLSETPTIFSVSEARRLSDG